MTARQRAEAFCARFGLRVPILQAPMAGVGTPALAAAVAAAGGLGGLGGALSEPTVIERDIAAVRAATNGAFQVNLFIPDPPRRDPAREAALLSSLASWGPAILPDGPVLPDFAAQLDILYRAAPPIVSCVMGLFPDGAIARFHHGGTAWFACATTVGEARAAEAAGAAAVVAQGLEAGGHRGAWTPEGAGRQLVGTFALVPLIADAVNVPVIAAGGVMDGRGVAAALTLGASAVQMGTAFLRCPETGVSAAYSEAIARAEPEDTVLTSAYSGRPARGVANAYIAAMQDAELPPFPVTRAMTAAMRRQAAAAGDTGRMQMWAGQAARLATTEPAGAIVRRVWAEAAAMLP